MENTTIAYLLKIGIASGIFYAIYTLLFRKDTFLKSKRIYLVFALLFSAIHPLITLQLPKETAEQIPSFLLPAIEINAAMAATAQTSQANPISTRETMMGIMASITFFFVLKFVLHLISVIRLRANGQMVIINNTKVIEIEQKNAMPFSFFNWIFINKHTKPTNLAEIITHENIHARQWHSVDVIIAELFCALFWWNPFSWLLKKEIRNNLEYLADKGVLDNGFDSKNYQYLLLQATNTHTGISIINNFNVSQLKKRIEMMNKENTSFIKSAKYALVLPVVAALLFSNTAMSHEKIEKGTPLKMEKKAIEPSVIENKPYELKKEDLAITNRPIVVAKTDVQQKTDKQSTSKDDRPLAVVEQMPAFPEGEAALFKFIGENLRYPIKAQVGGVQGRVVVRFVVSETGAIKDATILKGASEGNKLDEVVVVGKGTDHEEAINVAEAVALLDAEALRVINLMPNWIPGKQNGKNVAVYFTLPIYFRLRN